VSKFLILSEGGDGCGLAIRLKNEGHEVRIWIRELDAEHRCKGLVETADSFEFGEVIIADCTGFGAIMDNHRSDGRLCFGGSSVHDRLETDRRYAKEVMEEAGIQTPDSEYFTGEDAWTEAEEYIRASSADRLVFKPGGSLSGVVPSYVSSDNEDLLEMLAFYKSKVGDIEPEFEIQEFVGGIAISTEGWFDGYKWIEPFNHTIERKQFLNADLGPSGGCTGNLVWNVDPADGDPLVAQLQGLTEFLQEHRYVGPIDLNAVVGEKGIFGLEFTPRFGYDAFPTFLHSMYEGDFGDLVHRMAKGDGPNQMAVKDGYGAGVRITIPPWPNEEYLAKPGIPIRGWRSSDLLSIYPYDIQLKGDELATSGGWGIIGVLNGFGSSIDEAFEMAYKLAKKARIPDKQYRTDLAEVCSKDFRKAAKLLEEVTA
jgi:phosphoribosylamine---glycine ligase